MKLAFVALALVAVVAAYPQKAEVAQIVSSTYDKSPEGNYNYAFSADNGISQQQTGEVKEVLNEENKPQQVVVVKGSYQYPNEEGKPVQVTYFADETGYHAEGDSIPKPQ